MAQADRFNFTPGRYSNGPEAIGFFLIVMASGSPIEGERPREGIAT